MWCFKILSSTGVFAFSFALSISNSAFFDFFYYITISCDCGIDHYFFINFPIIRIVRRQYIKVDIHTHLWWERKKRTQPSTKMARSERTQKNHLIFFILTSEKFNFFSLLKFNLCVKINCLLFSRVAVIVFLFFCISLNIPCHSVLLLFYYYII